MCLRCRVDRDVISEGCVRAGVHALPLTHKRGDTRFRVRQVHVQTLTLRSDLADGFISVKFNFFHSSMEALIFRV